jgi:hypothetical protein
MNAPACKWAVVVGRDRGDLGVRHGDLRVERGELYFDA